MEENGGTYRQDELPPSLFALRRLHIVLVQFSQVFLKLEFGELVEQVSVKFVVDTGKSICQHLTTVKSGGRPFVDRKVEAYGVNLMSLGGIAWSIFSYALTSVSACG